MHIQAAPALRARRRIGRAAIQELQQHPFSRIAGTDQDETGRTVVSLPPPVSADDGWNQGALLGLRMLDAARACDDVTAKVAPFGLLRALFADVDTDRAAFDRALGFSRCIEMVLMGYANHRHHAEDAPFVIGLEDAYRQWSGSVVS